MHVHFRTRKYESSIDASFTLYDGSMPLSTTWMVGDSVNCLFANIAEEIAECMSRVSFCETFRIHNCIAHIPCTVVKRSHAASWKEIGKFQSLGSTVLLEADD